MNVLAIADWVHGLRALLRYRKGRGRGRSKAEGIVQPNGGGKKNQERGDIAAAEETRVGEEESWGRKVVGTGKKIARKSVSRQSGSWEERMSSQQRPSYLE